MKVYVGCSLTHAPEEFKMQVEELKQRLRGLLGVEVLDFLGVVGGTPHDVYVHDILNCVCKSDVMIAICDYPSTGLGWEMATQIGRGKTLLAFGHKDSTITRLILDPRIPGYSFNRYETLEDIFQVFRVYLERNPFHGVV